VAWGCERGIYRVGFGERFNAVVKKIGFFADFLDTKNTRLAVLALNVKTLAVAPCNCT